MRKVLLALCVCLCVVGWGQTFKGGTVNNQDFLNQYYKVTAVTPSTASVTVENASTLKVLDRVIVIQMTGAKYTPSTGAVSDYNSAGNYEVATICKIEGNTVFFIHDLINAYKPGEGKVQLVKIQKYVNAIANTNLVATAWDSARGTGGVLAISVENTLTLNGNISADTMGFKGGKFLLSTANCYDFLPASSNYYNPTDLTSVQSGAYKGESIVNLTMDTRGGRGAVANGGGGGNNHNNGGGGGSNLTAGGIGGGNASTDSRACQADYPGKGGYGLSSNNRQRIFLGGGGGSGHGNNTLQQGGGNGGGIIFLEAETVIVGTGNKISANGENGSNTLGDGASGGGAGGTIILNIENSSSVSVEAKGGKGGDEDERENPPGRCFGEGGGGSGGVIYIKGSQPTGIISVAGGIKGERKFTTCPLNDPAGPGSIGSVISIANYAQSTTPSDNCPATIGLPVRLLSFKVMHKGPQATAEWEVAHPEDALEYTLQRRSGNEDWKDIHTVPANERTSNYQKGDGPLATGIYLYRLKIVEKDRSVAYSPLQQIIIKAEDHNRLMIYPNPATSQITIVAPNQKDGWLNIYDMKSRLVYRKKINANDPVIRQDISFLSEGVYLLQVGRLTARFLVFK